MSKTLFLRIRKGLVAILLLTAISHLGVCQEIVWVRQSQDYTFLEGAISARLASDSHGNLIGLYNLNGHALFEGDLLQSNGMSDILVIKYDPDGHIIWKTLIGGPSWDAGNDLSIDQADNILIAGIMPEGGDLAGQTIAKGNGIGIIAKLNPDGELLWFKQFIGTSAAGFSITSDLTNNVLVGVRTSDYLLKTVKYSPDGTLTYWEKTFNQTGCCTLPTITDIQTDNLGNVFVIGDFIGAINIAGHPLTADVIWNVFIVKLTADGNFAWFNKVESPSSVSDESRSIGMVLDPSGNIYITGYFEGATGKFESIVLSKKNSIDDRTGYIAKLNVNGKFEWATAMYGRDVIPGSITLNRSSSELSVAVGANSWFNYNDSYLSSVVTNQSLILTVDLSGNFRRTFFVNTEALPSYLSQIVFNDANEFFVSGNFYTDFTIGCFDLHGGSQFTSFLLKSGRIPDIDIDHASGNCTGDTIRIQLDGSNIDAASKFDWVFPSNVQSLSGSFETVANYIDIKLDIDYHDAPFTVVPFYECYPRTEFASLLKSGGIPPKKPPVPVGDSVMCIGKLKTYKTSLDPDAIGYEWVHSPNLFNQTQASDSISMFSSHANERAMLQVRSFNTCGYSELSDVKQIRLNPQPDKPLLSGPLLLCAGQKLVKYNIQSDSNYVSYGWKLPHDWLVNSSSMDSSTIFVNVPMSDTAATIFPFAKGLCDNSDSNPSKVKITPPLPPLSPLQGSPDLCLNTKNNDFSIDAIPQDVDYHWNFPAGFLPFTAPTNSVSLSIASDAQSGTLEVSVSNRCFTSDPQTLLVTIHNIPEKPSLQVAACDRSIMYSGTDQFTWFKDDQDLSATSNVLHLSDSGIYKIEVSNLCGSVVSDDLRAVPYTQNDVVVPNVITPNGDFLNEFFVIGPRLTNSSLVIANRWGKQVYESSPYKNDWNGEGLSTGVYYFVLSNECLDKNVVGTVEICR